MTKKVNNENIEGSNELEIDEIIEPTNEFDLSVLKSDFEKAEKQAKEAFQDNLIQKADSQEKTESTENIQETEEMVQDFKELLVEVLETVVIPVNKSFRKKDVSQFDAQFIDKLVDKITKIIPKDKMDKVEQYIGITDKKSKAIVYFRIFRFISFVFKEVFTRLDEYQVYREAHPKAKEKQLPDKS